MIKYANNQSEVKEGFTDEPISVPDCLETEHIVDAFNQLLNKMKVIDTSRQEFVSNVSHELKTPLAIIKTNTSLILSQPDDSIKNQSKWINYINSQTDRMYPSD